MRFTKTMRTLLVRVGWIALVAVLLVGVRGVVAAYRGSDDAMTGVAAHDYYSNCTACALLGKDQCTDYATPCAAEKSKPYVDTDKCVGCGKCVKVAPQGFEMDESTGKAKIKEDAPKEAIERGAKACPVSAVVN